VINQRSAVKVGLKRGKLSEIEKLEDVDSKTSVIFVIGEIYVEAKVGINKFSFHS
jgi:hypothetical protein